MNAIPVQHPYCDHPHCSRLAEWKLPSGVTSLPANLCVEHWEILKGTVPAWADKYRRIDSSNDHSSPESAA